MMQDVKCLIPETEIRDAVEHLGREITRDYAYCQLTILGILTGSIVLVTDLMRQIAVPHQLGFVQASSYRGGVTAPGALHTDFSFLPEIAGRDILLVDDIFDTGRTITRIRHEIQKLQPRSIHSAVLLWKRVRTVVETQPDYFCFEIPDEFVVGYGLDYQGEYRHLRFIGVLPSG